MDAASDTPTLVATVLGSGACALLGLLGWSLVEYAIHGLLSHRFRTFVSPLHWGHHRTPSAVFTSPVAWVPIAVALWGGAYLAVGLGPATATVGGLLAGFARYEVIHWRLHFRDPQSEREERLRRHHLAHHFVNPRAYHGVTTSFWDRVFGTLPDSRERDYARVAAVPPLAGPSNLRAIWRPFDGPGRSRRAPPAGTAETD